MLNKIREIISRLSGEAAKHYEPPEENDDRGAGTPVSVRRGPPNPGSSVAVAEPDDDR